MPTRIPDAIVMEIAKDEVHHNHSLAKLKELYGYGTTTLSQLKKEDRYKDYIKHWQQMLLEESSNVSDLQIN